MNIYQALESNNYDLRVTSHRNNRWLLWDGFNWVVYEKKPYARNVTTVYCGDSSSEAIESLIKE